MDFEDFKAGSSQRLKRIQDELRQHAHTTPHRHLYKQVLEALDGTGLEAAIDACDGRTGKCGSIFCEGCCSRKIEQLRATLDSHFRQAYDDEDSIRANARYVTVLQGIVGVDFTSIITEHSAISAIQYSVDELRKRLKRVKRIARDDYQQALWMRGSIHLEMLNLSDWWAAADFGAETAKHRTLRGFVGEGHIDSERQILVHCHLVVDIAGMSDKDFRKIWDRVFDDAPRQVLSQRLYREILRNGISHTHTLDDAWKGISRYAYNWGNNRLVFANNWGSGRNSEVMAALDDFRVQVMSDSGTESKLTIRDIRFLVMSYDAVSGKAHRGLSLSWQPKQ